MLLFHFRNLGPSAAALNHKRLARGPKKSPGPMLRMRLATTAAIAPASISLTFRPLFDRQRPPLCPSQTLSSVPRSSTWDATSTSRSFATTPRGRRSPSLRLRGTATTFLAQSQSFENWHCCESFQARNTDSWPPDKHSATLSATSSSQPVCAHKHSSSSPRCTATLARHRSKTDVLREERAEVS